ncbi:pyruvate kinase [Paenibacillus yanchengensis]|uniref:Pyruvate kinase n=1 Tax=Paenibacillus yanchengensis TaxID=2035833 RepID=A0ABW4YJK2_9BACL
MHIDIQKLYNQYLTLNIPNRFTLEDIHQRLTTKYLAQQVDIDLFAGLQFDPHAEFETVVTAYIFRDDQAVKELMKLNNVEDMMEPIEINYIINSKDNIYHSGGTHQGASDLLAFESDVFWGMDKEEMYLGNDRFEEFLIVLYLTGYIQFENDPLIEQLITRYKDGYCLRYFGFQDGREKYLYK